MLSMDFTTLLRKLMKDRGLTHAALAQKIHVHPAYVSHIATKRSKIAIERIPEWADALQLEGDDRYEFIRLAKLEHAPPGLRNGFMDTQFLITAKKWEKYLRSLSQQDLDKLDPRLRALLEEAFKNPEALFMRANHLGTVVWASLNSPKLSIFFGDPAPDVECPPPSDEDFNGEQVSELQATTIERDELTKVTTSLTEQLDTTRRQLAEAQAENARLRDDLLAMGRQVADQRRQNELLHSQIDQIATIRARRVDDGPVMLNRMTPQQLAKLDKP